MGLEACSGAHFLGRALRAQGHDVRLIPAQFVKPFVKSKRNDFLDAEAIAEAVARQNMRFVPIKIDDQLDLQAIHRVRYRPRLRRSRLHQSPRRRLQEMSLRSRPGNVRELQNVVERSVIVILDGTTNSANSAKTPISKSACFGRLFKHLRMAFGLHW